jgi:cell division protein ZapA
MEKLKIKITIAGRAYPLSIKNAIEEEGMRKAAKKINDLVTKFEQSYAVSDKQDVLAMCALQFASHLEINSISEDTDTIEAIKKLEGIDKLLDARLK